MCLHSMGPRLLHLDESSAEVPVILLGLALALAPLSGHGVDGVDGWPAAPGQSRTSALITRTSPLETYAPPWMIEAVLTFVLLCNRFLQRANTFLTTPI
jgi:hypothetical protein